MRQSQLRCKQRAYENHIERLKEKYLYRENLNLVRFSNRCGTHINCFRFNLSEDLKHIYKKLEICINLMNKNHKFITEGIFENGSRCDILDLTEGVVYEIMNSENERRFREKVKSYPEKFEIIKIKI
mgnify:CR=1 FL=1